MKFIAKLKNGVADPQCTKIIFKDPKISHKQIGMFESFPIHELYEKFNPLYFLHDILDEDWVWMDGLPVHGKSWRAEINFWGIHPSRYDNRKTTRDRDEYPVKRGEITECYFLLSSEGDKLAIRLDSDIFEYSDDDQYTLLIGYSGSQKQLQAYMHNLGITSISVEKVYLNEFSSRANPWIQEDYYAD